MNTSLKPGAPDNMAISFEPIPRTRKAVVVVHSSGAFTLPALAARLRTIGFHGVTITDRQSVIIDRSGVITGSISKLGNLLP